MVTDEKKILTSPVFTLGMMPSTGNNPYQVLYRAETGFPNYKLDMEENIWIHTAFEPIQIKNSSTTIPAYHFQFPFHIADNIREPYPPNPEIESLKHLIPLLSARKVHVNDSLYSCGRPD